MDVGDRDPLLRSLLRCWGVTALQGLPQLLRIMSTQITLGPEHPRVTSEASVCRPGYCVKDQDP